MLDCRDCPNSKALYGNKDNDAELWCDKVGGKISWYGSCEDTSPVQPKRQAQHRKKRSKRERDFLYKRHLNFLAGNYFGCYYCDEIYIRGKGSVPNPKPYYKRIYRRRASKYLKKVSNRKIRRYKGEIPNGNSCHKLFDFWWELY